MNNSTCLPIRASFCKVLVICKSMFIDYYYNYTVLFFKYLSIYLVHITKKTKALVLSL